MSQIEINFIGMHNKPASVVLMEEALKANPKCLLIYGRSKFILPLSHIFMGKLLQVITKNDEIWCLMEWISASE